MSFSFRKTMTIFALAGAMSMAAGVAQASPAAPSARQADHAQVQRDVRQGPEMPATKASYPKKELNRFVSAIKAIRSIRGQARSRVKSMKGHPKQFKKFRAQVIARMVAAVKANHMTRDQFNGIVRSARQHPKLRKEIMGMIRRK